MPKQYRKLCEAGVDGVTLGDHVYKKIEIVEVLDRESNIIRPANLSARARGRRWMQLRSKAQPQRRPLYVLTVLGRVFAPLPADDPFEAIERVLAELPETPETKPLVLVEVHAEATSEKQAIARRFDGRVSAVLGTHTHVPTADTCILPGGTAFQCDLGMCGPHESIIGRDIARVVHHMTTGMPAHFETASGGPRINGVVVDLDEATGRALHVERIALDADPSREPFDQPA